jgi:hypothetical protein
MSASLSAESLERNELSAIGVCPFPLPDRADLAFLSAHESGGYGHKDISFDPVNPRSSGRASASRCRLEQILSDFSTVTATWIAKAIPAYATGLTKDRVTLRTQEEATRVLRLTSRNDLLHIDNFSTRPTLGRRILRFYVNVNPSEPQVWAISERFPELVARFAAQHRLPIRSIEEWIAPTPSFFRLFFGGRRARSNYDNWMLRLHHFLKQDAAFQIHAARKVCKFEPASAWLLFSDGLAHAHLRGRLVLEHSFFVDRTCLVCPPEWPVAVLQSFAGRDPVRQPA